MEKVYNVSDICDLFRVKDRRTARRLMRDMEHTERPLLVTERAVKAWFDRNTKPPESEIRRTMKGRGCKG